MSQRHSLLCFPDKPAPPVKLEAVLRRNGDLLLLCYLLRGELAHLAIPNQAGLPERRDDLWRQTCFELFLAPAAGRGYWELNLSPAGHWNAYVFDGYRSGMRPAPVARPSFHTAREESSLALVLEFPLTGIVPPGERLAAGLAAVLAAQSGVLSYWALCHLDTRADFHRRESFTLLL